MLDVLKAASAAALRPPSSDPLGVSSASPPIPSRPSPNRGRGLVSILPPLWSLSAVMATPALVGKNRAYVAGHGTTRSTGTERPPLRANCSPATPKSPPNGGFFDGRTVSRPRRCVPIAYQFRLAPSAGLRAGGWSRLPFDLSVPMVAAARTLASALLRSEGSICTFAPGFRARCPGFWLCGAESGFAVRLPAVHGASGSAIEACTTQ